jgi:hypothetical protein
MMIDNFELPAIINGLLCAWANLRPNARCLAALTTQGKLVRYVGNPVHWAFAITPPREWLIHKLDHTAYVVKANGRFWVRQLFGARRRMTASGAFRRPGDADI